MCLIAVLQTWPSKKKTTEPDIKQLSMSLMPSSYATITPTFNTAHMTPPEGVTNHKLKQVLLQAGQAKIGVNLKRLDEVRRVIKIIENI